MIEALVCGTPVLAFPEGAVSEIVIDGHNGFLVADEQDMAAAVDRLEEIDPLSCRKSVASRYDVRIIAERYEAVYGRAIHAAAEGRRRLTHRAHRARPPGSSPSGPPPPRATIA